MTYTIVSQLGIFASPGNIWQCLDTFLVVTTGGCFWLPTKKEWSGLKCCSAKAEKLCPIKVGGGSRALLAEYWGRDQRGRELEIWNRFITWGWRYSTCACCWEGSLHSGYMECPLRRPASLRNSVLAVLCRPGLIWGDVPMELGSHVSIRMTAFWNSEARWWH